MNKLTESASIFGVLAQLGERYAGSVEVRGTNPLRSTMMEMLSALYKALFLCFFICKIIRCDGYKSSIPIFKNMKFKL